MILSWLLGDVMKNAFVNSSLNYLIKHNACNDKQVNIFRYTLESLYSLVTKTCVVLILAFFLKTFSITLTMLLLYSVLRGFAFGIHATKNLYCWIVTLLTYVIGSLIIKYFTWPMEIIYICYVSGFLALLLWAPADTPARPLLNKRKRLTNKIFSLGLTLIYVLCSFYLNSNNFYNIVSFILILETICICPLTYKLFKTPYNNYKTYKG